MRGHIRAASALAALLAIGLAPASARELKVISDKSVTGFGHIESVAYDPRAKVLYTSDFGPELKPADKDGKGKITKVSLDGKIIEDGFLPAQGQVLNKPKGLWIKGNRLWATDIDSVWLFDLKTKEGKKLALPGITFANDPTVIGDTLYVSDNRSDKLARIEPADFLKSKTEPKVSIVFAGKGVHPNGIYPGRNGLLYLVGFQGKDNPQGIYTLAPGSSAPKLISEKFGNLDGVYRMARGDLLVTDWTAGALVQWDRKSGKRTILAKDIKGPADFCAIPNGKGTLVVVPDLVKGELRFVQLGR